MSVVHHRQSTVRTHIIILTRGTKVAPSPSNNNKTFEGGNMRSILGSALVLTLFSACGGSNSGQPLTGQQGCFDSVQPASGAQPIDSISKLLTNDPSDSGKYELVELTLGLRTNKDSYTGEGAVTQNWASDHTTNSGQEKCTYFSQDITQEINPPNGKYDTRQLPVPFSFSRNNGSYFEEVGLYGAFKFGTTDGQGTYHATTNPTIGNLDSLKNQSDSHDDVQFNKAVTFAKIDEYEIQMIIDYSLTEDGTTTQLREIATYKLDAQ